MRDVVTITKALADETRLRIVMLVAERGPCVCQIVEVLGHAPSTVSKHLSILKAAGLVDSYKRGRWIYYHLPRSPSPMVRRALAWVTESLAASDVIDQDRMKVTGVCAVEPEELARAQRRR